MFSTDMPELLDYAEKLIFKVGFILILIVELGKYLIALIRTHSKKKPRGHRQVTSGLC